MTTIVDAKKRVTLGMAKPGERFDIEQTGDGSYLLRRLEPVKAETKTIGIVKKKGFLMLDGKLDRKEVLAAIRADREGK